MSDRIQVRLRGLSRAAGVRRLGGLKTLIVDVDGTLTDGLMPIAGQEAASIKPFKNFGSDDSDAIRVAKEWGVNVILTTADQVGYYITLNRARQLDTQVFIAPAKGRIAYLRTMYRLPMDVLTTAYIGDGWYDGRNFEDVGFGIATANALPRTKKYADAILSRRGGDKAVAQAIEFVLEKLV